MTNHLNELYMFKVFFLAIVCVVCYSCKQREGEVISSPVELIPKLEASLDALANVWYPRCVDTVNGGFWSDFDYQWEKVGKQNKMLVSQARHVWTASTLAEYYQDKKYLEIAEHGYRFLRDQMWDAKNGGFHTLLGVERDSLPVLSKGKSTYGNSFAIYGLATYFKVSKDTAALNLAKKTFTWLEDHAHDSIYKGYFDVLTADGSWLLDIMTNDNNFDNFNRKDWKDQNSSIHLLESFSALYEVWPNPLVRERLEELLVLIRDTITTEKGYLSLHLQRDWIPVSLRDSTESYRKQNFYLDHVSFGHDVETAFLLLEASHILGEKSGSLTLTKAKKMVDHALEWGWDSEKGGFYDGGYYWNGPTDRTIENRAKVWWTQAEGLNSLLLMSKLFPEEKQYKERFLTQLEYIDFYLVDHKRGGWYHEGLDTNPQAKTDAKANIWKVNYHNIRSLINVIRMIQGEFELTKKE